MSSETPVLLRLHFVAKPERNPIIETQRPGAFETGDWTVSDKTADQAIGGELHLHEYQRSPSWVCGVIYGWRKSDTPGRVIFMVKKDLTLARVQTNLWAREAAHVREGDE